MGGAAIFEGVKVTQSTEVMFGSLKWFDFAL